MATEVESLLTEAGLWELVAIYSDAATNETASSPTRDPPQGTETCCTNSAWFLTAALSCSDY